MKKLYRYLIAIALMLNVSVLSPVTSRAQGVPTIDIQNLIQNIMSYFEDQLREGSLLDLSGVTKMEELQERWKQFQEKKEDIQAVLSLVQGAGRAASDLKAIGELGSIIMDDVKEYQEVKFYMQQVGSINGLNRVVSLTKSYSSVTSMLLDYFKKDFKQFTDLRNADPMELLSKLHDLTATLYAGYDSIKSAYDRQILNIYQDNVLSSTVSMSEGFMNTFYY